MRYKERWKPIKGWKRYYAVSSRGRIKNIKTGKILTLNSTQKGYCCVTLWSKKKIKTCVVHRIVAKAFKRNPKNLPQVDHRNGDKRDNRVSNLRYCDNRQNQSFTNKKHNRIPTSKYVGVCFSKASIPNPWMSQIRVNKKQIFLGYHPTELKARKVYLNALRSLEKGVELLTIKERKAL